MDWPNEAQSQGERMLLQCVRTLEPGRDAGDNMGNLLQGFRLVCQLGVLPLKQGGRKSGFFYTNKLSTGQYFYLKVEYSK